ncbi:hypothetical protein B0A53_06271 [Rhodotorula sp. CCFEE 5036]|nr:hypothetical protein B0A53_06271 [Rhodotorula sp. CCFEE 5036]
MAGLSRSVSLLVLCLLAILSVTVGVAAEQARDVAKTLPPVAGSGIDHSLEARSGSPAESYHHRSRPSRYEGTASAATLLRNAQLKAAAVDAGRSTKMKNVAFRAAAIKAAIANNYAKRSHGNGKMHVKRPLAGHGHIAPRGKTNEEGAEADLDVRAVERARRNVSSRPSRPQDHQSRPRSPQHMVDKAAVAKDAARQGKDRFRPREIAKPTEQDGARSKMARME